MHIPGPGLTPYGIDPAHRFIKALEAMKMMLPLDYIVMSGDLCYREESREIYSWARDRLRAFELPIFAISGNHDNPEMIQEFFPKQGKRSFFNLENGEWESAYSYISGKICMLFLDSHRGSMSDQQLEWLKKQVAGANAQHMKLLIFMHHPPLLAGVPHMDKNYAFSRSEDFFSIISEYNDYPVHIFCGHYHTEKTIAMQNAVISITPSTFFEIDPFQDEFNVLDVDPGFRVIDVLGTAVRSWVHRFRT